MFVVIEVSNTPTPSMLSLVEYLVTHRYDKVTILSDLCDHPSVKYKLDGSISPSTTVSAPTPTPPTTATSTPTSSAHQGRQRASINDIASALSKKTSPMQAAVPNAIKSEPSESARALTASPSSGAIPNAALTRLLEDQDRALFLQKKQEQDRQNAEIQRMILAHAMNSPFMNLDNLNERTQSPEDDEHASSETISKAGSDDVKTELIEGGSIGENDFGLGATDEQVRASMIHLLNPVLGSAFGQLLDENSVTATTHSNSKRKAAGEEGTTTKKHRWLTADELEESRSGRGKNCGRVHCKATYKCALCGKPTTLNSTGSRWNLLRHVIMIHSECKPYKCWDCDFTGIKSNVISHARQSRHRSDDAHDITTDEMRGEWNSLLHQCFPDYVRAKERGWTEDLSATAISTPEKTAVTC
ncbi:unnamed protein product [Caenorhabditis auriculariae]|uniref:C2H2-type domain-containing protein n=1 Tax=Caenorhabditis auriculariae TaxID=2777116 RepID=A0A8S1HDY6_9PELO|nr:unnamed protein product [Caenorhabditis auriculariae]